MSQEREREDKDRTRGKGRKDSVTERKGDTRTELEEREDGRSHRKGRKKQGQYQRKGETRGQQQRKERDARKGPEERYGDASVVQRKVGGYKEKARGKGRTCKNIHNRGNR